jgi:hypothetical protein
MLDLDQTLKGLDGKPIMEPPSTADAELKPMKLRDVLVRSALFVEQSKNPSGEDKFKGYLLAQKLHDDDGTEEYSIEEMALIKEQVGKMWMPITVGIVWKILEAAGKPIKAPVPAAAPKAGRVRGN